jgi:hypothetical protein
MTTTRQRPASPESALAKVPANIRQASTSLSIRVSNVDELKALARVFAVSGMFGTANNDQTLAKCAVQLMAGMEAGFTPFASITGIYVINGKPGFSAQLLAQAIKRHPHYDYRVLEKTAKGCTIRFLHDGEILGEESFTSEMAQACLAHQRAVEGVPRGDAVCSLPDGWHEDALPRCIGRAHPVHAGGAGGARAD